MSKVAIGKRVTFEYGYAVRVNEEASGIYPIYGSNGATGYINSYKVKGPGVIIGRKGSVGKITYSENHYTPTDTAYYLNLKDTNKDDMRFWSYFLPLLGLEKLNTHSAVPGLSREIAYLLEVDIPEKNEQVKIAKLISTIDAKIELNNRITAELESMAKTLYDYWFVQFNFPDNNGKPYKSSGGKMIYNETLKRKIPAGWVDGSLWDIAKYYNGLAMQKFRPETDEYLPVIKIKEMSDGISDATERASVNIPKDAVINDGDILFSWSATLDVKIWSQGKGALNQHIFKVTSNEYPKTFYYFELLNYLQHFKMMADMRKTTMGHITQDHLKQSKICIPQTKLLESLHKIINPIFEKQICNEKENQKLSQIKNWLLPMLMNARVKVYD